MQDVQVSADSDHTPPPVRPVAMSSAVLNYGLDISSKLVQVEATGDCVVFILTCRHVDPRASRTEALRCKFKSRIIFTVMFSTAILIIICQDTQSQM